MQIKFNDTFSIPGDVLSKHALRFLPTLPRDWGPDEVNKSRDSKGSRNRTATVTLHQRARKTP